MLRAPRRGRGCAATQIEALDLRPVDPERHARTRSGGNQQKVLLARWLVHGCTVLLLDEPTRGVDVGARSEIYALIRDLSAGGAAVVVVPSEIDEVLRHSDRVLALSEGRVVHRGPASEIDEHKVLDLVLEASAVRAIVPEPRRARPPWQTSRFVSSGSPHAQEAWAAGPAVPELRPRTAGPTGTPDAHVGY